MTQPQSAPDSATAYTGVDNLEVMREAENYNRYLLELVGRYSDGAKRMIDFGAGSGTFAIPLTAAGLDVIAVEPDEPLRTLLTAAGIRAVADAASLPDASFPYAYTLNVLEHITDDVDALRSLRRKLQPGGALFVYVPAFPVLFTSMDAKVRHVRRYTRTTLRSSLLGAGFELETMRYVDSLGFAATLLFKAIDNGRGEVNRRMLRIYDKLALPLSLALDAATHRWLGKNLLAVARNPVR
jgi:SAM-dependent methyltransferase